MVEIFTAIKANSASEFVFPGDGNDEEDGHLSNMAMLELMRGMRPGMTVHGTARSTFKDWAAERTNFPDIVSEMALGHAIKGKVEKAYRRGELIAKRTALMDAWAAFCASTPKAGNVTMLADRRASA